MDPDLIDEMNTAWRGLHPDLDPSPLELVGRVLVLAQSLERGANEALAAFDLTLGQFDILATLRREGSGMTPTQLMRRVVLSSGGMTNRLDRLEQAGLIRRQSDPADRRGVVVELTPKGRRVIDKATAVRFDEAAGAVPDLSERDRDRLADLLRQWLKHLNAARS